MLKRSTVLLSFLLVFLSMGLSCTPAGRAVGDATLLAISHVIRAQLNQDYLEKLPPLIDRELFFGDPQISSAELSPDGEFISFIKPYRGVRNIWVKRVDEPFDAARPVTADDRPVPGYFWSEDSDSILYVQDKGGNENFHVYAVDLQAEPASDTGVPPAKDLTPLEGVRAIIYSVPESTPDEIIVGLNDRDATYHDVYRININTGEKELILKNEHKVGGYVFDLSGQPRLAVRQTTDGGTEILRLDGQELTQIYSCSFGESCFPNRFHKDGQQVYLQSDKGEDVNLSRLMLLNVETGEHKVVESDPEGRVDFGGAVFSEKTDELIATVYVGDRLRIYPKDEKIRADLEFLRQELPEGEIRLASSDESMNRFLVSVSSDVDPGSVYFYQRDPQKVEKLYESRPELPSQHLAEMKPIRYKARDGLEIPGYLTLPRGVEAKNLPTVVHPHGGPWSRDTWGYDGFVQFLANRGYAVFQPNFRGSTGYGKDFVNAGNKEWGIGAMQHDITDGVKYLIQQGITDPDRIGIFGGSYGGYATLAGAAFTPDLYAAAVPYVAPSNLITLIESFPAYWGPFMKIWHLRVGDPKIEADHKDLLARSPLFKADEIKTPMLVVHGANDPRVTQRESDQIVIALRETGLPVQYLVAPDEGHGFRAPANRLALAAAMEKFFAGHLGGRYQKDLSPEVEKRLEELTVDPSTVELTDISAVEEAETAPLPETDISRLVPATYKYAADLQLSGQQVQLKKTRKIEKATWEGNAVWKISETTESPMGSAVDTAFLDSKTLAPRFRTVEQGPLNVELRFHEDAVKGKLSMAGREQPIDVSLPGPVLVEGPAFDAFLTALELQSNFETTVRIFDVITQKIKAMSLKVAGQEEIQIGSEAFPVYKVELTPLDGSSGGATFFVSREKPMLVKSETKLPAQMGGATVITRLDETSE